MNPSIVEKLRKLHALSERAGTEAEAANATQRIRELLDKHNLDIGVLDIETPEGVELATGPVKKQLPEHWPILAHAVNILLDVESFTRGSDRKGWRYSFIGLKANVEAAAVTFAYLIDSVEDLLDTWKHEPVFERLWSEYSKRDYRAFRLGAAKRIYSLILEQKRRAAATVTQELVHIGNAVAKRMMDGMRFENVVTVNAKVNLNEARSYEAGYLRGDQVDPKAAGTKRIRKGKR